MHHVVNKFHMCCSFCTPRIFLKLQWLLHHLLHHVFPQNQSFQNIYTLGSAAHRQKKTQSESTTKKHTLKPVQKHHVSIIPGQSLHTSCYSNYSLFSNLLPYFLWIFQKHLLIKQCTYFADMLFPLNSGLLACSLTPSWQSWVSPVVCGRCLSVLRSTADAVAWLGQLHTEYCTSVLEVTLGSPA